MIGRYFDACCVCRQDRHKGVRRLLRAETIAKDEYACHLVRCISFWKDGNRSRSCPVGAL